MITIKRIDEMLGTAEKKLAYLASFLVNERALRSKVKQDSTNAFFENNCRTSRGNILVQSGNFEDRRKAA